MPDTDPISDDMLNALEREAGRGLSMEPYQVKRMIAELRRLRAALAAADANPVLRFLARRDAEWIGRGEYAVKPSEPVYDHWMAEYETIRDGEAYGTRRWGPTPEAACSAALKAMEGGDDGE